MSNTKNKILNTSRLLFNELGYSQVTIRMIALKLDMSSGNLNYHFKKREDILEALYFEMVAVFDDRIKALGQQTITLKTIKDDMYSSMNRMLDYQFFWTDLYNILLQNDKIKAHFNEAYKKRQEGTKLLLNLLIEKQLLNQASFEKEYAFLIEKMIAFGNTWLYNSSLYQKKNLSKSYINQQANILLSFLYPHLSETGKKELKALVPDFF